MSLAGKQRMVSVGERHVQPPSSGGSIIPAIAYITLQAKTLQLLHYHWICIIKYKSLQYDRHYSHKYSLKNGERHLFLFFF